MNLQRVVVRGFLFFLLCIFQLGGTDAGAQVRPQVVRAVDNAQRVTLAGNVHPLAIAANDRGAVAESMPMARMLLLLKRSDEQETALQAYMEQQQSKSSPNYHAWLAPEQFGAQYGPADADIQAVTDWLTQQGFTVGKVYSGKTVIEFSGTAGQVQAAFGTSIRNFAVNGKMYSANASDPQIPAALAPVVAGVVSLNSFPRQSHARRVGQVRKVKGKAGLEPLFTFPNPFGSGTFYGVAPADFATIYNSSPLISAGNDGTGQTIAIVGETNLNVQDVQTFRSSFALPATFTASNIILNGEDPGITSTDEEGEADLDTQWSGAVAPGAKVDLVVSATTAASAGIDLSALYIIENNFAGVMSESYGSCEASLGAAGNSFYNTLWEQAAAQGITVILSAGDGGSAGCDDFNTEQEATQGIAVSGLASTPFNVSVGGTDFDQANVWTQYWNANNNSMTAESAKGYIPEIPWNDSCAQLGLNGCNSSQGQNYLNIVGGSGGPSSKYSKPTWQMGVTGIPNDGHRDQPDVALFASSGFNSSGYVICQSDQNPSNAACSELGTFISFSIIGGTSASAPTFAGVMALVNQYQATHGGSARQGNANYVLYQLAKKTGASCVSAVSELPTCIFNDVTHGNSGFSNSVGTNSVPCGPGTRNCSVTAGSSIGVLEAVTGTTTPEAWLVNTGYDMATGLGSVNIGNLAALWGTVSTVPTTTTLTLSPTTGITHGTAENVGVTIAVNPASGTATGDVSLIAKLQNNATQGIQQFTLAANGSVTATTQNLPGGTYSVYAHYAGDGTNAPSDSAPVQVVVAKENSETFLIVPLYDSSSGKLLNGNASSVPYGSAYRLRVYVTNSQGVANPAGVPAHTCDEVNELTCPTGSVTLTSNGTGIDKPGGVYSLDNIGYTRDINPTLTGGSYSLLAQYSGDASYLPSTSAASTLTVTPVTTQMSAPFLSSPGQTGTPITISALVTTTLSSGVAPTGTITFFDGTTPLPGTVTYTSNAGAAIGPTASISGLITATFTTAGTHSITAKYSGDANYAAVTSPASTVQIFFPTTLTLTGTSTNLVYGQSITVTLKLTSSNKSPAITGTFSLNGVFTQISNVPATASTDANGNQILTGTAVVVPQFTGYLYAQYSGDANYSGSASNNDFITVVTPDFSVPASTLINVTAGQSGTGTFQVTPASNIPSTVSLTTVSIIFGTTVTLTPTSVSLNGSPVPVTVTVSSTAPSTASPAALRRQARHSSLFSFTRTGWWSTAFLSGLLALYLFGASGRRRKYRAAFFPTLLCLMSFAMGCGEGGGGGSGGGGGGGPVASTITMTSSNTKLALGGTFTLTANVSSAKPVTGTVTFYQGSTQVAPPIVVVNGQASTIITNNYAPGIYPFTAAYSGDSNNLSSQTGSAINEAFTGLTGVYVMGQTGQITHQTLIQVNLQ